MSAWSNLLTQRSLMLWKGEWVVHETPWTDCMPELYEHFVALHRYYW